MKFFDVAQTPKFMKELGLSGEKFTIRYGVISRHFGKDREHTLPMFFWEQFTEALLNPFAITKYYEDEDKKKQKGYRLYTSLQLDNGAYVVVSAEVKNAGRDNKINAINTIFGRSSLSDVHDGLIYVSETITPEQQSLLNGNNPHQYTAEQELSTDKYTETSSKEQGVKGKISEAEKETDTNPTEAQKEAGNYKKGHVKVDGMEITIEQPKGSVRRGVDKDGKQWENEMHYTYGYIRRTEGVDGDHIDIFLSDNPEDGKVFVVDQVNEDGSFDEHKVMYGFNSTEEAKAAYLSNYEKGWKGLGNITEVSKEEFKKWIDSSHRKTKPFAEYKGVKTETQKEPNQEQPKQEKKNEQSKSKDDSAETSQTNEQENEKKGGKQSDKNQHLRKHKADGTQPIDNVEKKLRNALVGLLRKMGLKVSTDSQLAQSVIDRENERVLSKGLRLALNDKENGTDTHPTSINDKVNTSPLSGINPNANAKIDNRIEVTKNNVVNLNNLTNNIRKNGALEPKAFLLRLEKELGSENKNPDSSQYFKNPKDNTLRLANHRASAVMFLLHDHATGNTSVVVKMNERKYRDNKDVEAVEFVYFPDKLDEDAQLRIIDGIRNWIETGEYNNSAYDQKNVSTIRNGIRSHRVYHGSGAFFNAFDHSHMGEGEGSQAYGWGTYVTEVEGIGRTYANIAINNDPAKSSRHANAQRLIQKFPTFESFINDPKVRGAMQANGKTEADAKAYYDRKIKDAEPMHVLYTVEIPEDNRENYLHWEKPIPDKVDLDKLFGFTLDAVLSNGEHDDTETEMLKNDIRSSIDDVETGEDLYKAIRLYVGDKAASMVLSEMGFTGISYPADYQRGGRSYGARNFVIFKEADAKITDHVRFLRTKDGEVYGFTVGGEIYIDPRIATSETAIHEYAHLWADMMRAANKEEWQNIVELMKGTPIWDEVKMTYPELKTDDEIADEVLAHYSGRRGAERLREAEREIARSKGTTLESVRALSAIKKVKDALQRFWKGVADMLGIHFTTAEDVADKVLSDLLNGVNPNDFANPNDKTRMQFVGEKGAESLDKAEEATVRLDNLNVAREMEKAFNEKKARIEKLRKSEPISITGNEYKGKYELNRDSAQKYILENLRDEYTVADTGEHVKVTKKGAKKVTSHSMGNEAHLKSIVVIPEIIKNAVFIDESPAYKNDAQYDSYRYYVIGLKVDGVDYTVRMTIGVKNGEFYYDHYLTEIEKGNLIEAARSFKPTEDAPNPSYAVVKDTKLLSLLQTNEQENARKIKFATGWERGADGKWRYEIMDGNIKEDVKFKDEGNSSMDVWVANLGDLFESEELFKAYPQLRDTEVIIKPLNGLSGAAGTTYFGRHIKISSDLAKETDKATDIKKEISELKSTPEYKEYYKWTRDYDFEYNWTGDMEEFWRKQEEAEIKLNDSGIGKRLEDLEEELSNLSGVFNFDETARSVIVHEIQHLIQDIEGFAQGGNVNNISNLMYNIQSTKKYVYEYMEGLGMKGYWTREVPPEYLATHWVDGRYFNDAYIFAEYLLPEDKKEEVVNLLDRANTIIRNNVKELGVDNPLITPEQHYNNLSGEVEARNVQKRMDMSAEERRSSIAKETEDVAREDQIFIMENVGFSEMGSRVKGHMAEISNRFKDAELDSLQRDVVDVYSGKSKTKTISVERKDGNRNVVIRQGNEKDAGTKHSLYRHYKRNEGTITADDILLIPEILKNGERNPGKKTNSYTYQIYKNGVRYTVVTQINNRKETFNDFYSNRKKRNIPHVVTNGLTRNKAHTQEINPLLDAAKVQNNSESTIVEGDNLYRGKDKKENSGYTERRDGSKISVRASEAEYEGTYTKGAFMKRYGVSRDDFDLLKALGVVKKSEWHHTGAGFTKNDFYSWADSERADGEVDYSNGVPSGSLADVYQKNKKEIGKWTKHYGSAEWENRPMHTRKYVPAIEDYVADNVDLNEEERKALEERHNEISDGGADLGSSYE